jgi:hypothetical protein
MPLSLQLFVLATNNSTYITPITLRILRYASCVTYLMLPYLRYLHLCYVS